MTQAHRLPASALPAAELRLGLAFKRPLLCACWALLDDFPGAEGLPGTFVEGVLPESFRLALDKMAALAMALQGNIDW